MADENDAQKGNQVNDNELTPERIAEIAKNPEEAAKTLAAVLASKRDATLEAKKLRLKQEAADKIQKDKEDAALAEQGKFKELSDKHKGDADAAKSALAMRTINFELRLAAIQAGAIDPADALALCNREGVKLSDNGDTVTGATEAIAALKKSKAHLFKSAAEDDTTVPEPTTTTPALKKTLIVPLDGKTSTPHEDLEAGFNKKK